MRNEMKIVRIVSNYYGVDLLDNMNTRKKEIAIPRQIAMSLIYKFTKLNLTKTGNIFKKDHSTVSHAIKNLENISLFDKQLKKQVQELSVIIRSNIDVRYNLKKLLIHDIVLELNKMDTESVTKIAKIIIAETPN